ncbi:alpha/beta hydrolase [Leptolyngbya sp. FACHB-541]|uniref:alpha/beta fold hydrolase n=1 Tax=Leptolyngbya sp. FACHB-541 TaxID=2692810 RepID=UPI001687DE31|nr:alpha/beta hydrolase [Leptolyngbya sp. FACHB-541]MBD2000100.1 alpha/beta hydrolase [Leptolyngbya sp. FACHB-541]
MSKDKPSIVLVHGAWADATSWQHIIPLLQQAGYTVTAVQNPLTSLPDDVATTKRVIDAQEGPVVAVGHSYGGAIITGAADGNPQVKALVYIAGWALGPGESVGQLIGKFPPPPLATAIVADTAGFLYIDREKFHEVFAKDVSPVEARVLAVTQKPPASLAFGQSLDSAAWKTIPSWYLVSQEDQAINPELQRFMADRIGAKTTEIKASHVSYISQPREVANLIIEAATSAVTASVSVQ